MPGSACCPRPIRDATHLGRLDLRSRRRGAAAKQPLGDQKKKSTELIGGVALMPLPPDRADLEIGWQVTPALWGHGYGAEDGHAVAHHAFEDVGISEVFAVVRPGDRRGVATDRRIGMARVGETEKYYGLFRHVYRLSIADLDFPEPRFRAVG
jgi:RimJ/RimL family protein N-acetyltransferase